MNAAPPAVPGHRALLVLAGRSALAFHELHGEPLYAHALRALDAAVGEVEVVATDADRDRVVADAARWRIPAEVLTLSTWWERASARPSRPLVVHDALCPLVTADFITTVLGHAAEHPDTGTVAVRAVTDTLKAVVDGRIAGTIDRDQLVTVTSPVVIPAALLAGATQPPPVTDGAALVGWLRERGPVELVRAPSLGRRIEDVRAVRLLESLDEVGHRVRTGAGRPVGHPPSVAEDRR